MKNNVINLDDNKALACTCGSVKWNLLKSGRIECCGCNAKLADAKWKVMPIEDKGEFDDGALRDCGEGEP